MASFNAAAADMPGTKRKQLDIPSAADDDRLVLVDWDSKCVFEIPGHQKENAQVRATKNLGGVCRVCVEQDEKRGVIVLEVTKLNSRMKAVLDGSCIIHDMFTSKGKMCIEVPSTRTHIFINEAPPTALLSACKVLEKNLKCHLKSKSPGKTCANTVVPGTIGSRPGEQKLIEGRAEVKIMKRSPTKSGEITRSLGDADLCADQRRAVDAVMQGKNVFLTGGAGTGKSALLRYIIAKLEGRGGCIVTASTGVAACAIAGTTFASFLGLNVASYANGKVAAERFRYSDLGKRWRSCRTLIIDEISMLNSATFAFAEEFARVIRNSSKPFGGMQVVTCGDFFQLPPVARDSAVSFAFEADAWDVVFGPQNTIELKQTFRQEDPEFIALLNEVREGHVSSSTVKTLTSNVPAPSANDAWFTTLCTHKEDADRINASRLAQLNCESHIFQAEDKGSDADCRELKFTCPARETLLLKEGATVILLRNLSAADGLVNGRTGVVKHIEVSKHLGKVPVVRFSNGTTAAIQPESWNITRNGVIVATRTQLPLDLAWAFSVHKSQGMSLDYLRVSLSKCFEAGQGYVALSRARSLAGLHVLDMDASTIRANPKVSAFYQKMRSDNEAMCAIGSSGCSAGSTDASKALQVAPSGILDTLKDRWSCLMASVQTNIEETIQDATSLGSHAASLMPFGYPSLVPVGSIEQSPLSQRNVNVPVEQSPLKKQRADTSNESARATSAASSSQQQTAHAASHSSVGVTGEKLVWIGTGSLSSACSCLALLKQRAYLTQEQCDACVERMKAGDAAAVGLWTSFESRDFADFLSFLQPLQRLARTWVETNELKASEAKKEKDSGQAGEAKDDDSRADAFDMNGAIHWNSRRYAART